MLSSIELYEMVLRKDIKKFPNGMWLKPEAKENAIALTKYLIEEKLKWSMEDIKKKLSIQTFKSNKLGGMLFYIFNDSPYSAINMTYPNKFKPWELKYTPMGFWDTETGIQAIRWLVDEKLKWSSKEIKENLCLATFYENGLRGMLGSLFRDSPYEAINSAYPNKFKPWEFSKAQTNVWTIETSIESVKWLIESVMCWTDKDIKENLSTDTFSTNGLKGMLKHTFKNSPYLAINTTYPNRFYPWELKCAPNKYWDTNTGIKATRWLLEKLSWSDKEIEEKLCSATFQQYGLSGMLKIAFRNSTYEAINTAYPNRFKIENFKTRTSPTKPNL